MLPWVDISLIIPTRNRRPVLQRTLERLTALSGPSREIIVIDNGSLDDTATLHDRYPDVQWIEPGANMAAAARNLGAAAARGRILFMLDDDSWPEVDTLAATVRLFDARPELGAVACRVRLADETDRHDAGGVPGVYFNCGAAVRREAFLSAGGYPADYEYYVEEYALACRMWQQGWTIEPRGDLTVRHARVMANRDNNRMLRLLVRNNLRLWERFAPARRLNDLCESTLERYSRVARREDAWVGYEQGVVESRSRGHGRQRVHALSEIQFSGLYGLDHARRTLDDWVGEYGMRRVGVWTRGKACEQVVEVLDAAGLDIAAVLDAEAETDVWRGVPLHSFDAVDDLRLDGLVIGTLSPGVAEDCVIELQSRLPRLPAVSLAPWLGVPQVSSGHILSPV